DRPFAQDHSGIAARFEDQGRVLRQFDGARDPVPLAAGLIEHSMTKAIVYQDAEAGIIAARPAGGAIDKILEIRNPRDRLAMALGDALQLDAMIEGEVTDFRPVRTPGRCPVNVIETVVVTQGSVRAAMLQEMLEFDSGRAGGGGAVARDHQRAAGVRKAAGFS